MSILSNTQRLFVSIVLALFITCSYLLSTDRDYNLIGINTQNPVKFPQNNDTLSQLPKNDNSTSKIILFWGLFYKKELDNRCITNMKEMDFCPVSCIYTSDPNYFNSSHAVVVHGREYFQIPYPPPYQGIANQRWVFLMFESPFNSKYSKIMKSSSFWNKPHIFNWTMTYRLDSDVPIPYGYVKPLEVKKPALNIGTKTKFGAWAVTNCNTSTDSNRNVMMERLRKALEPITIDQYGACGNLSCPGPDPNEDVCHGPELCYQHLGKDYKFYFSFENSICPDYVTEKFFNALKYGMVPVVLGPGREFYERLAPPHSFIHVNDFDNVGDLADYLVFLDEHPRIYGKYLEWRTRFEVDKELYFRSAWCQLCQKLYEAQDSERQSYDSITDWWYGIQGSRKMKAWKVRERVCTTLNFSLDGSYSVI